MSDSVDPRLAEYDVSATRGFVPDTPPATSLPGGLAALDEIAPDLASLTASGRLGAELAGLPSLDVSEADGPAEQERALLILSALAAALVHGPGGTGDRVSAPVAVPLVALARAMERPPVAAYPSIGLRNWSLLGDDPTVDPHPRTVKLQVSFTGTDDELWFLHGGTAVEVAGGRLPALALRGADVAMADGDAALADLLEDIAEHVGRAADGIDVLREGCRPEVFYDVVRPAIAGWGPNGVVYEGVSEDRVLLVGATAAQSPLIATVDGLLGIEHPGSTGDFLRDMRSYMSREHRALVADVEAASTVRSRVDIGGRRLGAAYDAAVVAVEGFRRRHMRLVHDYVVVPSRASADEAVGTGGTTVSGFLRESRVDTERARPPLD